MYHRFGKRLFDLTVTLLLLPLLLPCMLLLALLVRLKLGSPIFFTQVRPGLQGKPFLLRKFRTMTDARDAQATCCRTASGCPLWRLSAPASPMSCPSFGMC
ncbi:MAG: sugar transferase [Caldilineaceae bacterium]